MANMLVQGKPIQFQIDTGATCNVLREKDMPSNRKLERCQTELTMFNQSKVRVLGKCRVNVKNPNNRKKYKADFIVVKQAPNSVLGAPTEQQMELVMIQYDQIQTIEDESNLHYRE